jgi:hypothetical protein
MARVEHGSGFFFVVGAPAQAFALELDTMGL